MGEKPKDAKAAALKLKEGYELAVREAQAQVNQGRMMVETGLQRMKANEGAIQAMDQLLAELDKKDEDEAGATDKAS
jgi:hypothetical protein